MVPSNDARSGGEIISDQKSPEEQSDAPNEPDAVGYCRPPRHSQFKKGQSGNPSGRKTGCRNLIPELLKVYTERVVIKKAGRRCSVPAIVAVAQVQCQRALNADPRAAEAMFKNAKELGLLEQACESSSPDNAAAKGIEEQFPAEDIARLTRDELELLIKSEQLREQMRARRQKG